MLGRVWLLCVVVLGGCSQLPPDDECSSGGACSEQADAGSYLPPSMDRGDREGPSEQPQTDGPDGPGRPAPEPVPEPEQPPPPADIPCETGAVTGLACAPDGSAIAGALVQARTVDCAGQPVIRDVAAGPDGRFRLPGLAAGATQVRISAGRFEQISEVVVVADQDVPLDDVEQCLAPEAARVAIVSGEYDSIESVVGEMGFEFDFFCGGSEGNFGARALIGNWATLSQYDVLFINCGTTISTAGAEGRQLIENLRRFADEGGAVYVSDLAAYVVEAAWPAAVDFRGHRDEGFGGFGGECCTCVDCPPHCGASMNRGRGQCLGVLEGVDEGWECDHVGEMVGDGRGGHRRARVDSPALREFVGAEHLDIDYEDGGWVEIGGVSQGVDILVSDGAPLMVSFPVGENGGRVTFTTFHNHSQVQGTVARMLQGLLFQL